MRLIFYGIRKYLLLFILILTSYTVSAQSDGAWQVMPENSFDGRGMVLGFDFRGGFPSSHDGIRMRSIEADLSAGYQFDSSFSLFFPVTWTTGLFKAGDAKTYATTGQLGVGLGYSPLHTRSDRLELSLKGGSTLGGDWQYLYYDCGLRWQSDVIWKPLSVGAGVRYYDCYGGGFRDYCNFYISVGIRILYKGRPGR